MSSVKHPWSLLFCLLVLCVMTGCSKTDELEDALRRAEKAEKTLSSLRQVQNELISSKKDLELQILELQQPGVTEVNDVLAHDVSEVMPEDTDTKGQEVQLLKQQLLQARAELKERDKDIQELQDLVEALTQTVNQLQGENVEDTLLDEGGVEDPNLLGDDGQE